MSTPDEEAWKQYPDFPDPQNEEEELRTKLDLAVAELKAEGATEEDIASFQRSVLGLIKANSDALRKHRVVMRSQWDVIRSLHEDPLMQASALNLLPASSVVSAVELLTKMRGISGNK